MIKELKKYLIISFISLLISLYLFEGYLTYKLARKQILKEKLYKKQTKKKMGFKNDI